MNSVHNILSFYCLPKNTKIKNQRTIILSVVGYGRGIDAEAVRK